MRNVLPMATTLGKAAASRTDKPQSRIPTSVFKLYANIEEPPGEPTIATTLWFLSITTTGDMDERGRLPPSTALATFCPSDRVGVNEKSVSWLLRKNPPTWRPVPK